MTKAIYLITISCFCHPHSNESYKINSLARRIFSQNPEYIPKILVNCHQFHDQPKPHHNVANTR